MLCKRFASMSSGLGVVAAFSIAACAPDASRDAPTSATLRQAAVLDPGTPGDPAFYPLRCSDGTVGDVTGDSLTGNRERDIVGNATYPAFYRAVDDTRVHFRMRVDLDPRHPNDGQLQPSSWDLLFDADGDLRTYEYMLTVDGNLNGTKVLLLQNSVKDPSDPRDPANDDPSTDLLRNFAPASDYYSVRPTGDGSGFSGDPDFFITLSIPISDLRDVGIDLDQPVVVWGGTNAQNYSLNGDILCSPSFPSSLVDVAPDPASLDLGLPDAAPDDAAVDEDGSVDVTVLANDWGLRDEPQVVTIAAPPAHGDALVNPDGTITYTPTADWNGTDTFSYVVADADGQSSTATVTVTVAPADDGPPVAQDDAGAIAEDSAWVAQVLANDVVVDGPATLAISVAPAHGTVQVNADGTMTYVPGANWNGTDSFTYTVTDLDGQSAVATVVITVAPVNDGPPVAQPDQATTWQDVAVTTAVLANDSAPDLPVTVAVSTAPAYGSAQSGAEGTITYTPAAGWTGTDSYSYSVTDADGETSTANVTVVVGVSAAAVDESAPTTTLGASTPPVAIGVAGGGCSSVGSGVDSLFLIALAAAVWRRSRRLAPRRLLGTDA